MLEADHLVVVAPSMPEGLAHARACLGLDLPEGGRHREMGTCNHLLRLGDGLFLEVIAADEVAPAPERPRWFGLGDPAGMRASWAAGRRLRSFVARTRSLDRLLARHGARLGEAVRVSRGDLSWRFGLRPDGALPEDGALPCPIDWGEAGCPAPRMPDLGVRLVGWSVAHPAPGDLAALYGAIGLVDPPAIRHGPEVRFAARIATPAGERTLT